jgi:hypothetical protein
VVAQRSKLRVALAGAAVVVVLGVATPAVLGTVTLAVIAHRGVFDAHGVAYLGLLLLAAVAWFAWLRCVVDVCLDVASGLRQRGGPAKAASGVRGALAGWVLGLTLMVLPSGAIGGAGAGASTAPSSVTIGALAPTGTPTLSTATLPLATLGAPSVTGATSARWL